jgi:hypothetical protein
MFCQDSGPLANKRKISPYGRLEMRLPLDSLTPEALENTTAAPKIVKGGLDPGEAQVVAIATIRGWRALLAGC